MRRETKVQTTNNIQSLMQGAVIDQYQKISNLVIVLLMKNESICFGYEPREVQVFFEGIYFIF
jgi:hypothetical protein